MDNTSFAYAILVILCPCSRKKMIGPHTEPYVAVMAYAYICGKLAVELLINPAVGSYMMVFGEDKRTVPVVPFPPLPEPARLRAFLDLSPESLQRWFYDIPRHQSPFFSVSKAITRGKSDGLHTSLITPVHPARAASQATCAGVRWPGRRATPRPPGATAHARSAIPGRGRPPSSV